MSKDVIDRGLKAIIKALKSPPHARVGILAGKSKTRKGSGPTNAEIGAAHEFGAPAHGLRMRSFLRMPINDHLEETLGKSQKQFKLAFEAAKKDGTLFKFLGVLGIAGESVCRESFTNGGWGVWPELAPATLAHKTVQDILVETTQLRESITSEVVK